MNTFIPKSRNRSERIAELLIWIVALVVSLVFVLLVGNLLVNGLSGISVEYLTSMPKRSGLEGGILSIICSTLLVMMIAIAIAVPLSMATAVLLSEFSAGSWFGFVVERALIVLAAVPSIVFGLFGNAVFCHWMGLGYSILSGGLTLACMILPIVIRALQAGLESVPNDYRTAAAALGISKTRTVTSILLPAAAPGLIVGIVLGIGRVMAETAALLLTCGYEVRMPGSLLDSGRTLSIHIYDLSNLNGGEPNAYSTALVLVLILLVVNLTAIVVMDRLLKRRVSIF